MQLPYMVIMIGGTNMGQDRKKYAALLSARARESSSRAGRPAVAGCHRHNDINKLSNGNTLALSTFDRRQLAFPIFRHELTNSFFGADGPLLPSLAIASG